MQIFLQSFPVQNLGAKEKSHNTQFVSQEVFESNSLNLIFILKPLGLYSSMSNP